MNQKGFSIKKYTAFQEYASLFLFLSRTFPGNKNVEISTHYPDTCWRKSGVYKVDNVIVFLLSWTHDQVYRVSNTAEGHCLFILKCLFSRTLNIFLEIFLLFRG